MSRLQIAIVIVCAASLLIDGYDIQAMSLIVPTVAAGWHLTADSFGWALSAVVAGITAGSAFIGPLADRLGRRRMLAAALLATGIATLCTATARSPLQFVVWRLLTGLALGAGIPCCAALTSEYTPARHRSMIMAALNIGSPAGAFLAGLLAPPLIATLGWRGTFLVGGILPLLLTLATLALPESLKYLWVRDPSDVRIKKSLARIAPELAAVSLRAPEQTDAGPGRPIDLLRGALRTRTLLLWAAVALNLFQLYLLIGWLPTLLLQIGWQPANALRGGVLIQAGGVLGGLIIAWSMDRGASRQSLLAGNLLAALCLALFSLTPHGPLWAVLLILVGIGMSGLQLGLNVLSAAYYPPAVKAAGISWAIMIGGLGSMAGPLAGAMLLHYHLPAAQILALLAVPSAVSVACVWAMRTHWQSH